MNLNRRIFLKSIGLATASPMLLSGLVACSNSNKSEENKDSTTSFASAEGSKSKSFGIQLWTVKDFMEKDAKGTLKLLADYGYTFVESFTAKGEDIFWGMGAKGFNTYLDSIGLKMHSSHSNPEYSFTPAKAESLKKLADEAASIGMTHLINPYLGNKVKTIDDAKRITEGLNKCGQICSSAGIKYAYHNHHYSFTKMGEEFAQDIFMNGTNADLVDFELDIYWVVAAGQDPIEWLKKYPNRFKLCHVKDIYFDEKVAEINKKEKVNPDFPFNASCNIGSGKIDFPKILKVADELGMIHHIAEQERFDGTDSMSASKANAEYMKKMIIA